MSRTIKQYDPFMWSDDSKFGKVRTLTIIDTEFGPISTAEAVRSYRYGNTYNLSEEQYQDALLAEENKC